MNIKTHTIDLTPSSRSSPMLWKDRGTGEAYAWQRAGGRIIAKEALALYHQADLAAAVKAFDECIEKSDGDPYLVAAMAFYNVTAATKEQRLSMKTILFAHIYGKQPPAL